MTIFARVTPQQIRVREKFPYRIEISANSVNLPAEDAPPEGWLEANVPYDGYDYFSRDTAADLEQQAVRSATTLQIGRLIRQTPAIDASGEWRDGLFSQESLPLTIPTRPDYFADQEEAVSVYRYQPNVLAGQPLQLTAQLLDDEVIMPPSNERYLRNLTNKARPTGLHLLLEIKLILPYWLFHLAADEEQTDIRLTQFSLQWPTIPDPEQINLWLWRQTGDSQRQDKTVADLYERVNRRRLDRSGNSGWRSGADDDRPERLNWLYDPHRRSLQFEPNQPWWRVTDLPSQAACQLTTALLLQMRYPGDLYPAQGLAKAAETTISGQLQVELDGLLLSGSTLHYFDALGQAARIPDIASLLPAKFEIFLEDNFKERETNSYWLMSFTGLTLTRERLLDIRHALGDLGYEIDDHRSRENLETKRCRLHCRRWEMAEGHFSQLTLTIRDEDSTVQWEQEVPGGAKFTAEIPVGKLTIEARGQLAGGSVSLNYGLSQLQARLKERLYPMSTLQ